MFEKWLSVVFSGMRSRNRLRVRNPFRISFRTSPGLPGGGACRRRKTVPDSGRVRTVVGGVGRIPRGRSAGHCPTEGGYGLFLLGRILFGCARGLSLAEFVERRTAPQFEMLSQIDLAHHRVGSQLLGRTRLEDFTLEQQVGTVGDGQRFIDVVVGDDDADILVLQRSDDALDVFDSDRIDACERFVEQDEAGLIATARAISVRRRSPPDSWMPRLLRTF